MRTIETKVYQYDELSDEAKKRAREWIRESESEFFGQHGELWEPAETAARILGISFDINTVKLMGGGTRQEPNIMYSGFSSQGDGASFTGSYAYQKGSTKAIRKEFGTDEALWRIADDLAALQRKHGYKLACKVTQDGRNVHQYSMDIEFTEPQSVVEGGEAWYDLVGRAIEGTVYHTLRELMQDFAGWIYKGLETEYNYRLEDEQLEDGLRANEYEFTEDGKRA